MKPLKINNELTIRDSHGVDVYFSEIQKYEPLTSEQEVELCERIRNGDESAREELILHNLKFVISVAKRYQSLGYRLGDLIAIGNIGIIKAAQNFDYTKGFKFISYAVWWIRQQIMSEIGFKANGIKLPGNRVSVMYRINRFKDDFYTKNQREPDITEISEYVGLDEALVNDIMLASEDLSSINTPVEEGSDKDIADTIRDTDDVYCNIDDRISIASLIREELDKMKPRQAFILRAYFGVGLPEMNEEEIACFLGTTMKEVRSITQQLKKIRK